MFEARPTYPKYRTLLLLQPHLEGEDVYALQTALNDVLARRKVGAPIPPDGVFSTITDAVLRKVQKELGTSGGPDGRAGPSTWERLANDIALAARKAHRIATGLLYGQLSHESGFRGGIYSDLHAVGTSRESWDAGIAQLNSKVYPAIEASFTVPHAIDVLAKNTRDYYDLFEGVPEHRRWELAAGAHNAPAWACWLALRAGATNKTELQKRDAEPTAGQRDTLERYIASCTAYLRP